ncbi:hypothetical protein HTZ77_44835 [Nonomuraea sp. SMC257]|uniref:Uncharacterized protein n=1 Tax=Nonomuraea montanisoli TaxID=2741721 RepID=A0A7Y6IHQ5_9ACTN|nr:hypothetical protein [Nonomuraea montanisoli]NUW38474.1 hypothetical protein [Nonomuraea montanisoli]
MTISRGYQYTFGTMAAVGHALDEVDDELGKILRILETECQLSQGAFGWAAELDGRRKYASFVSAWRDEVEFAMGKARELAEKSAKTDRGYLSTENARLNDLLYTVGWKPDSSGKFKKQPELNLVHQDRYVDNDGTSAFRGLLGSGLLGLGFNAWALRRYPEWKQASAEARAARKGSTNLYNPHTREAIRTGRSPVPKGYTYYERFTLKDGEKFVTVKSQSAVLSNSTVSKLHFAKRFSLLAVTAGVVWELLVIPSDEDLNRAMHGWEEVAARARALFGSDLPALNELALADWSGVAKNEADDRIFRFIRGGIDLADFATEMANRLAALIEQFNALHKIAYIATAVTVAALIAHAALSFIPAMRIVAAYLGSQLTTLAMFILAAAPAAAARVFAGNMRDAMLSMNTFPVDRGHEFRFGWK